MQYYSLQNNVFSTVFFSFLHFALENSVNIKNWKDVLHFYVDCVEMIWILQIDFLLDFWLFCPLSLATKDHVQKHTYSQNNCLKKLNWNHWQQPWPLHTPKLPQKHCSRNAINHLMVLSLLSVLVQKTKIAFLLQLFPPNIPMLPPLLSPTEFPMLLPAS